MNLYELYDYAVDQGIDVDWYTMPFAKSFTIFIPSLDRRAIALDPWKFETVADEFTTLGHEVGHCMTYSFYNRWAACDVKKKHENRADKWEIEQFIPWTLWRPPRTKAAQRSGIWRSVSALLRILSARPSAGISMATLRWINTYECVQLGHIYIGEEERRLWTLSIS